MDSGRTTSDAFIAGIGIYFDGMSSRRRAVTLVFSDALEIGTDEAAPARWAYADIRRADSPSRHVAPVVSRPRPRWRGWRYAMPRSPLISPRAA